ncbi:MAG: hypothetical protein IKL67_01035 [Tidjanibacter sp.]|nr:hypothetical protein [Tidjanibacter sp.]
MKKSFMILGATLLALAAVGCQNDAIDEGNTPVTPDEPIVEEPAEVVLHATLPESRTTLNADYSVSWKAGDAISVFYQKVGEEGYSENTQFIIDEELTGKFTPATEVALEDGANYNWYVCSPHAINNETDVITLTAPNRTEKDQEGGYFAIGATNQRGYNNSDHVASMDIMVGKAESTRTPSVALKHLAVLHKFTVKNDTEDGIVIEKLTITGNTNIFGAFWIDLTANEPAIDRSKANRTDATFNSRELTILDKDQKDSKVANDDVLAAGESADFYMITAPFTLGVGETFTIKVKTKTGEQTFTKTATEAVEFKAGTYNTANLTYDYKIEYADHLYYEQFDSEAFTGLTGSTNFSSGSIKNYDKAGLSVYDGDVTAISYDYNDNASISRYVASSVQGMTDTYLWLRTNNTYGTEGYFTIKGIKLHEHTALTLSFLQAYKNSTVKVEYSIDGGETWVNIVETKNPNAADCQTHSEDFTVTGTPETIDIRFTKNDTTTNAPRIDNIKLTWQTTK